jgi:hypothetical protein
LLQVRISYAQRNLQTALSEKNVAGFYAALWQFVGIIIVAAPSFALAGWLEVRVHGQLSVCRHTHTGTAAQLLLPAESLMLQGCQCKLPWCVAPHPEDPNGQGKCVCAHQLWRDGDRQAAHHGRAVPLILLSCAQTLGTVCTGAA